MKSVESSKYEMIWEYFASGISDRKGTNNIKYDQAIYLSVSPKFSWNFSKPNSIASSVKKYLRHFTNWQNWINN
jgi:hypothetical protein